MPLNDKEKEKTVFSMPHRTCELNFTLFVCCNAGASQQWLLDITLLGLSFSDILAYMDDITYKIDTSLSAHCGKECG